MISLPPTHDFPLSGLPARGTMARLEVLQASDAAMPQTLADADTLIVPIFAGENGMELAGAAGDILSGQQQVQLWKALTAIGATGKAGEKSLIPATLVDGADGGVDKVLAIGMGDADDLTDEDIRQAAGVAARTPGLGSQVISTLGMLDAEAALLGHALGSYTFRGLRQAPAAEEKQDAAEPARFVVVTATKSAEEVLGRVRILAAAVAAARDLVNTPANFLYPASYAELITQVAQRFGVDVEVLEEEELEQQGYGGIIGVGRGSSRPPRLVRLQYVPQGDADAPFVALVGKGITFDTGGISLKPGANMWNMISDMGGSAAVFAATLAAAALELPVRVTATIPLAENMPGGGATRPGDVLRHYGGKTTEVLNTDAEGRLILADAIVRACEDEPDYLIETATLTGAQMVALGERTPGIMGSVAFRDRVAVLSQEVGENGWPMPLPQELGEALRSDVADLQNISTSRWGGMSVAGHYLKEFVAEGVQWVHIDVAGPAYNTGSAHGYTPKRGTGVPVRTIVAALEAIAAGKDSL